MKMRYVAVVVAVGFLLAVRSFAGTYTWKGNEESSWGEPGSYVEGNVPNPDVDHEVVVVLPDATTARVDNVSIGLVNKFTLIKPQGPNSCLIVDLDDDAELGCPYNDGEAFHKSSANVLRGVLLKKGAAMLTLKYLGANMFNKTSVDYFTAMTVEAGKIRWDPDAVQGSYAQMVDLKNPESEMEVVPGKLISVVRLTGSGKVSAQSGGSAASFAIGIQGANNGPVCVFNGKIEGGVAVTVNGEVHLMGTNNTFTSSVNVQGLDGILGFRMIGADSSTKKASSIGTGGPNTRDGCGRYLYLGEGGESTIKNFTFWDSSEGPCVFDAGAKGGITFNMSGDTHGIWTMRNSADLIGTRRLVLTGSNETACVFNNAWASYTNEAKNVCTFFIRKQGTGVFRFNDHPKRNIAGVMAVDEGTVEFASIAEKGEMCSLGYSTDLYPDVDGAPDPTAKLPYAFLLGTADTQGTLKYCGTGYGQTLTRPIALDGEGRLTSGEEAGHIKWRGISAASEGLKTLVLDGADETGVNTVWDVSNGVGRVAIRKEGTGTWTVDGRHDFTGGIEVKEGMLVVNNYGHYTWYKLVLKRNWNGHEQYGDGTTAGFRIGEFALYDDNGVRQNTGIAFNGQDWQNVVAGQCAYTRPGTLQNASMKTRNAANMFDDAMTATEENPDADKHFLLWYYADGSTEEYLQGTLEDETTWQPVLFRLGDHSSPCVRWDIAGAEGPTTTNPMQYSRNLRDWSLEASVDGVRWDTLTNVTDGAIAKNTRWLSDDDRFSSGSVRKDKGFEIASAPDGRADELLKPQKVAVAAGATLKVNGTPLVVNALALDALSGQGGRLENVAFASSGELDIADFGGRQEIRVALDLSAAQDLDNLESWTVRSGDRVLHNCTVSASASGITITKPGCILIVR